jgi:tetratricopeptide (TPR) repeat protein
VSERAVLTREPVEPGALWVRWESPRQRFGEEEARRRVRAEALFAELAACPPEKRSRALKKRQFREPALVELLLEKSREAQPEDPEEADTLAMMAAVLALQLCTPEENSALMAVFLGRANCLAGNARRLMGNEAEAELAFENTVSFLARSAGSCDRAFFCRSLALLRWEQGRIDEAASLLHHAGRIFAENGAVHEEGTSFSLLGLLYIEEGDPRRAVPLLRKARLEAQPERRPWLAVRARLGLAYGLGRLGHLGRARWMLREAWELFCHLGDLDERIRAHWLEGRVCSLLGPEEEAEALLDGVRVKFLEDRLLPEAALASLDLALHRVESRRGKGPGPLAEELQACLGDEDGLDIALRGLRGFERGLEEGRPPRESADGIASFLRRTFRFRGFRVEPLPFA